MELEDEADLAVPQRGDLCLGAREHVDAVEQQLALRRGVEAARGGGASVLLPTPDSPMIATRSPGQDVEVQAPQHLDDGRPVDVPLDQAPRRTSGVTRTDMRRYS